MRLLISVVLLVSVTVLLAAEPAKEINLCRSYDEIPRIAASVVIDAATGKVIDGTTSFPDVDRIQIILINKNPWKYDYDIRMVVAALDESIVNDFFTGKSFEALKALPSYTLANSRFPEELAKVHRLSLNDLGPEVARLIADITALQSKLNTLSEDSKAVDEFKSFVKGDTINCKQSVEQARKLADGALSHLAGWQKFLQPELDQWKEQKKKVEDVRTELLKQDPIEFSDANLPPELKTALDSADAANVAIAKTLGELEANERSYADFKQRIEKILLDENAFASSDEKSIYDHPALVTVTIIRQSAFDKDSKPEVLKVITVRSGKSKFSISYGFGVSGAPYDHIVRHVRESHAMRADSSDSLYYAPIFGRDRTSARPLIVALLNYVLCDMKPGSGRSLLLSASTGFVLNPFDQSPQLEFVVGPTFASHDDKFHLSLLAHVTKLERLAGGYRTGDPIPNNLTDPLPVHYQTNIGFAAALTYHIE